MLLSKVANSELHNKPDTSFFSIFCFEQEVNEAKCVIFLKWQFKVRLGEQAS